MNARIAVCLHCAASNRVPEQRLGDGPKCGGCGRALIGGTPVAVDMATLQKAAGRDTLPLLVDFWAPWCGPCKVMAPEFERSAAMLAPAVRLAKIDTEAHPAASARWNIRGIPAFVLFSNGREIARLSGARPATELVEWTRAQIRQAA